MKNYQKPEMKVLPLSRFDSVYAANPSNGNGNQNGKGNGGNGNHYGWGNKS